MVVKIERFKNNAIYSFTEMSNEKYLDELVIELTDLTILKKELTKESKSRVFLENLGLDQIENYIQNAIRKKIPLNSFEDGELYVFTPYHGFRYQISGSKISTSATRFNEFGSEGTLDQAIEHINKFAEVAKKEQRKFSINVLFYDELSKTTFNEKIKPTLDKSHIDRLKVPNYGYVQLHNYWVPHFK